jgi:plasmid stabilization system protein ParE
MGAMARVLYLPDAMERLRQIWSYVAHQSQSLEKADRLIDSIDDAAIVYARNHELGKLRSELADDLRCFAVWS